MQSLDSSHSIQWLRRLLLVLACTLFLPFVPQNSAQAFACNHAPKRPRLVVPLNNTRLNERRVALQWTSVDCVTAYSIQVRKDEKYGRPVDGDPDLLDTHFTTRRLQSNTAYWWLVEACNPHSCKSSRWHKFYLAP